MSLPTSRHFVTQLLDSLSSPPGTEAENPLSAASEPVKKKLLSLQVLFPNEFLPALDLLDRRLVTRLRVRNEKEERQTLGEGVDKDAHTQVQSKVPPSEPSDDHASCDKAPPQYNQHDTVYYVRSAQQRSSRYSTSYDITTSYEVRLLAWNCSCPAFAFSAFSAVHPEPSVFSHEPGEEQLLHGGATHGHGHAADVMMRDSNWTFGGVTLGSDMPPVCKHLLACVLVEKCSNMFGAFVQEREVCVEEAAGWAAGWGD